MSLKERISAILAILFLIVVLAILGYISSKLLLGDHDNYTGPVGRLALYELILSFQKKYSRWPNDKDELQKFVSENKININLRPYQRLIFKKENDNSIRVYYAFKLVGWVEQSTFVLSR